MSTMSVCCAGLVLNIHHRDPGHPVPSYLKCFFQSHSHPTSWTRSSTLRRRPFRTRSGQDAAQERALFQETVSLSNSEPVEHIKELQVVCETKVKVRENGENEVQRLGRRGAGGGGGGGGVGCSGGCLLYTSDAADES